MMNKRYEQNDKLQICFTRQQANFLQDEKMETGDTKSSIVRKALNEYIMKRIGEKLKKREKIKDYMVKMYGELKE